MGCLGFLKISIDCFYCMINTALISVISMKRHSKSGKVFAVHFSPKVCLWNVDFIVPKFYPHAVINHSLFKHTDGR